MANKFSSFYYVFFAQRVLEAFLITLCYTLMMQGDAQQLFFRYRAFTRKGSLEVRYVSKFCASQFIGNTICDTLYDHLWCRSGPECTGRAGSGPYLPNETFARDLQAQAACAL